MKKTIALVLASLLVLMVSIPALADSIIETCVYVVQHIEAYTKDNIVEALGTPEEEKDGYISYGIGDERGAHIVFLSDKRGDVTNVMYFIEARYATDKKIKQVIQDFATAMNVRTYEEEDGVYKMENREMNVTASFMATDAGVLVVLSPM